MDARFSGGRRKFHNGDLGLDEVGKKKKKSSSLEWDLNDWKWDGYNFVATPLNGADKECGSKQLAVVSGPNGSSSSSGSEETHGRGELEKRRKVVGGADSNNSNNDNNGLCGGDGPPLSLKLGGLSYSIAEEEDGNGGRRSKLLGGNSSRPVCQVEGCRADLSSAKDYHRRHKVCEMHAKASWATVGDAKQRFCQQCSRLVSIVIGH